MILLYYIWMRLLLYYSYLIDSFLPLHPPLLLLLKRYRKARQHHFCRRLLRSSATNRANLYTF